MSKFELYGIAFVVLVLTNMGLYLAGHHRGYLEREQKDEVATAELQKKVDQETQELRDHATKAENTYAIEHQQLQDYRLSHPDLDVSKLCDATNKTNLSSAKGTEPRSQGASTAAAMGTGVPTTDSLSGQDRREMLSAFAALFDDKNSVIREFQNR